MARSYEPGQLDSTARYAIKLSPQDNLAWMVEGLSADLAFERWLDTEMITFPGEKRRRCDTVAELVSRSGEQAPWAVALEVESRPRSVMPGRLLEYLCRLFRRMRYEATRDPYLVAGALIVLTGKQKVIQREMRLPGTNLNFAWTVGVKNVALEDARTTLEKNLAGLLGKGILPWVPLMAGADEAAVTAEWVRVALTEADEEKRRDYGGLARVFAGHVDRLGVWDKVLEGWQMEESVVIREYTDRAAAKARVEQQREALLCTFRQ